MPKQLSDLYADLCARAQEPAPEGARALYIAGRRCGWATHAACDALRGAPGIAADGDTLRIGSDLQPGASLNDVLEQAAQLLRQANCLRGWRDELLDVLDGDEPLGVIERAAVRPLGLLTKAVHLNAWTPDGRLWVARRALSKSTDPGMWDTLVGGLAGSREDLELALVRECGEEAGLDEPDLTQRSPLRTILRIHRRLPEGYQVEDVLTSTCVLSADVRPANRDGEVMEIATIDAATAVRQVAEGEFTLEAALVIIEDIMQRRAAGEIPA
ncbi:NUDIX hydrolase [Achromobacter insolitus]|uniref:Isopentenyl-diphosphate Delta-isomerase n=1 Tax=Achromobacter insolitus TaxID=217204 RepID=A0A6S7FID2_9BURK|nr:NUDIX domain-containing protein [Achromobacter insolitus]CAB3932089.1 Isopentenyl-diphosphate Delta-isomerase [Achromobacter insolitus]CAB3938744.1 Isopentenyl-diphosphate Delta-isomerase [Achromobacter insolitus]